jgi:aspartyl-tRNA(Asn)/glutamyl-tRNA(Gln) amidotransferase subunit A
MMSTLSDIQAALLRGDTTCKALVKQYLARIEATRHLNAYVEVWTDEALARADDLDERIRTNPKSLGRLFGAVASLKDNICYEGHEVTAASKILEGYKAPYHATAVARLIAADVILIGRTNCDQFGMGSSNENSVYGPVLNAADPKRVPGGSTGGGAVSVQTDTCLVAIGSDTGGSVRQPAAFCGIYGFKPTYGRISRYGLLAYGSSFDQIGFLAKNALDIAAFLEVSAGPDDFDSTAVDVPVATGSWPEGKKAKIAWIPALTEHEGIDDSVKAATKAFLTRLEAAGHTLVSVDFDLIDYLIPAYYVLTTAEASSNLARYDGIRYGYRSPEARNLQETYLLSRTEGFSAEVKRRILLGTFVLSSGYYDAYYNKAQQVRRLLRDRMAVILNEADFLFMPTAPTLPWRFGEKSDDPVAMYLEDIYTVLANLTGVPALSIPVGNDPQTQLPIGVQLLGKWWKESDLLSFAATV